MRRRWGLFLPWSIAAALGLGWTIYWGVLAAGAQDRLQDWSQAQQARTGEPAFDAAAVAGFPLRLEITLQGVRAIAPDLGRIEAETVVVNVNPTNPSHLILAALGPIRYRLNTGSSGDIRGEGILASLRARTDRGLARASLEAAALAVSAEGAPQPTRIEQLAAHLRPDPRNPAHFQLAVTAQAIELAAPPQGLEALGPRLERLFAALVLTTPDGVQGDPSSPLAAWAGAGGQTRVERLELLWGGVRVAGDGRLGLDPQRRPEGAISARLENASELVHSLASRTQGRARLSVRAVGPLLSEALDAAEAEVVAAGGGLDLWIATPFGRIGPARLRELDPVY
jgi:hypothetical protein